jgi:hypothetical protein
MNEWKYQRFVAVESAIAQDLGMKEGGVIVVMTDLTYWISNVDECREWCDKNGCRVKGMTIEIPDAETMTLFVLRWAG